MTVSCQLIVGNISDVLTPTILDDLLKVLRTGAKYNGMVARITELHQMEVKIQSRLAQVVEYERRLEAVRLARVKLQHLMSEPCTKVETVDQQIHGIEATKSQPNDTTRNFIPIFIENFVPNTSAEKTP
ncbi:hypothetical protein BIW11_02474 [Tropilaelaps mercedesae]|uniref:Uncharacterized protein n=1 Tax=Tropilaelaps mercedesae TaxID=418985 RepID=A0A1V9Y2M7_9ACAR|nr:hypothetical protein BIW11_02474 [Tropilaelaps mercedesae]